MTVTDIFRNAIDDIKDEFIDRKEEFNSINPVRNWMRGFIFVILPNIIGMVIGLFCGFFSHSLILVSFLFIFGFGFLYSLLIRKNDPLCSVIRSVITSAFLCIIILIGSIH